LRQPVVGGVRVKSVLGDRGLGVGKTETAQKNSSRESS
jgi:hypothetical protein